LKAEILAEAARTKAMLESQATPSCIIICILHLSRSSSQHGPGQVSVGYSAGLKEHSPGTGVPLPPQALNVRKGSSAWFLCDACIKGSRVRKPSPPPLLSACAGDELGPKLPQYRRTCLQVLSKEDRLHLQQRELEALQEASRRRSQVWHSGSHDFHQSFQGPTFAYDSR